MPKALSAADVAEFRARLCAVAQHRFARHGPEAVSMRQLADALGCSPMTPYRYFRNKNEILAAVRAAAFDRFAAAMARATRTTPGDLLAMSRAVGDAYIRFAFDEPDAYRLMFDLSQPHPERYPELVRATARARATMSVPFKALVNAGIFNGDPERLGFIFWATMHGLIMLHFAGKLPETPDFSTLQREARRLLVDGARAPLTERHRTTVNRAQRSRSTRTARGNGG
jgi:AcrR family transcriptional regulator